MKAWVPPVICTTLTLFVYFGYTVLAKIPTDDVLVSPPGPASVYTPIPMQADLLIFNVLVLLFFVSFVRAIITPPGAIPTVGWNQARTLSDDADKWLVTKIGQPGIEFSEKDKDFIKSIPVIERKQKNGGFRFCAVCKLYKPDRVHHCKVCKQCVLRMDHHCPWIGNCVGFNNYKFFLLVLFYGIQCTGFIVVTMFTRFIQVFRIPSSWLLWWLLDVPVGGLYLVVLLVFTTLTTFFSFHIYLVTQSMSTIELKEKKNHSDPFVKHRWRIANIKYNNGGFHNLHRVLGTPCLWLLPLMAHPADHEDGTFTMNLPPSPLDPPSDPFCAGRACLPTSCGTQEC